MKQKLQFANVVGNSFNAITDDLISTDYNVNVSTEYTTPPIGNLKQMTWRSNNIDQQAWDSRPVYVTQDAAS
jgi:hypothetical protein